MVIGTALITLTWALFVHIGLPFWAGIIISIVAGVFILFGLLFIVYFFNLDMKLTSKLQPLFIKHYDKRKREKKI